MIEIEDLVKRYPGAESNAVDGLSLAVAQGEVFGLLGPNGAGKSTTVSALTTRTRPSGGRLMVGGIDVCRNPTEARSTFGVVPQRPNLDNSLTVRANLTWHAAYHGLPRRRRRALANELLERMGLEHQAHLRPDKLSGGQAQRLLVARAMAHEPRVLFLDEPSTGLDPQARLFVHERIAEFAADGVTVLLTTHDMNEAATVADRVGIIDHGRLLALDSPLNLTNRLSTAGAVEMDVIGTTALHLRDELAGGDVVQAVQVRNAVAPGAPLPIRVLVHGNPGAALPEILAGVAATGGRVDHVELEEPSLEDVFIGLTGRGLR